MSPEELSKKIDRKNEQIRSIQRIMTFILQEDIVLSKRKNAVFEVAALTQILSKGLKDRIRVVAETEELCGRLEKMEDL